MMYPAYDGVVDAGLLPDDHAGVLSHQPTSMEIDSKHPRVELTIKRLDY